MARRILISALCIALLCAALWGCGKNGDSGDGADTPPGALEVSADDFIFTRDPDKMCGDKLYWTVKDNTLLIAGEGDMDDYDDDDRLPPWYEYSGSRYGHSEEFTSREFDGSNSPVAPSEPSTAPTTEAPKKDLPEIRYVKMQDGITSIGSYAFYEMLALKAVYISNTTKRIGERAFPAEEFSLERIDLPASVTEIGECAFEYSAVFVEKGNRFYSSDEYGVLYNKDKTKLLQFPAEADIRAYTVPDTVTELVRDIANDHLEELVFPENLRFAGDATVWCCSRLRRVVLPRNMTSLPYGMFDGCGSLEEVTLPASLEEIGKNAFGNCSALKTLTLPRTLRKIDESAFWDCSALTVTFEGSEYEWKRIEGYEAAAEKAAVTYADPTDYFDGGKAATVFSEQGAELNAGYEAGGDELRQLSYNTSLTLLGLRDDRAYVELNDGTRGWCYAYELRLINDTYCYENISETMVVLLDEAEAPLYAEPQEGAAELRRLLNYSPVYITGQSGDFYRVKYTENVWGGADGDATEGYMPKENVWSSTIGGLRFERLLRVTLLPETKKRISELVETVKPAKVYTDLSEADLEPFFTAASYVELSLWRTGNFAQPAISFASRYSDGYNEYAYPGWYRRWTDYGSLEELVAKCLSLYSPEVVKTMLTGRVIELNGAVSRLQQDVGDGPPREHAYRIADRTPYGLLIEVTFTESYESNDSYRLSYRVVRNEDGDGYVLDQIYDYWGSRHPDY